MASYPGTPSIVHRAWRAIRSRRLVFVVAAAASTVGAGALAVPAGAVVVPPDVSGNYSFQTLNNDNDPTFNQLLGINNGGVISGYFGSGMSGHPNKGYLLFPGYHQGNYRNENFPGSAQTQVTGLNNTGLTVGFWVDGAGNNHAFYRSRNGHYHTVDFPTNNKAKPMVDQLLGVNDNGIAVGFYTDGKGVNHGFTYNVGRNRFRSVGVPGDSNLTAAGTNGFGDVAGFATNSGGSEEAFLLRNDGKLFRLNFPGAASTQAFGVNNGDEVVGDYVVGSGQDAKMHGFVWAPGLGFHTVNDPNGTDTTTINGLNDRGTLVGFYVDSQGHTDGLLAKAQG